MREDLVYSPKGGRSPQDLSTVEARRGIALVAMPAAYRDAALWLYLFWLLPRVAPVARGLQSPDLLAEVRRAHGQKVCRWRVFLLKVHSASASVRLSCSRPVAKLRPSLLWLWPSASSCSLDAARPSGTRDLKPRMVGKCRGAAVGSPNLLRVALARLSRGDPLCGVCQR